MKKTIHTLLTAALFATANMSAMPVVAEDGGTVVKPETAEPMSLGEQSEKEGDTDSVSADGVNYNILKATTKSMAPVYGPPPTTTVNTSALIDVTTTTTQPVYGTQPTISLTSTTTSLPEWLMTTTTTTVEILYGPVVPRNRLGDVNEDGDVDIFDLVALRKILVSGQSRSFYSDNYADVNFDRKVNMADLVRLQQFLLGKIDSLYDGQWDFMRGKTIEPVGGNNEQDIETTTTTTYKPGRVTTVTLYGIMPARSVNAQYIDPDETTYTTAEEITPEEK
ncbi:dockerin type I repeat-containing protein [Ruminococcus flavefaciens]|uniref:dockerin type I repeat-containing protein n=1 Tax=Ruminococcus flavefaciens TaxID=1265 RepID=UPI00048F50EA|nr:dockerin type I repeat-containing protein [Ruminococcus flavefaciens]